MRLYVYVLEARGLPAPQPRHQHGGGGGGGVLLYAKVTVGKQRFRTREVEPADAGAGPTAAAWNEEFAFAVGAEEAAEGEEFEVAVARRRRRRGGGGRGGREVVGAVRLPVPAVSAAAPGERRRSVPPTWFTLRPVGHRRKEGGAGDDGAAADCGASSQVCFRELDTLDISAVRWVSSICAGRRARPAKPCRRSHRAYYRWLPLPIATRKLVEFLLAD